MFDQPTRYFYTSVCGHKRRHHIIVVLFFIFIRYLIELILWVNFMRLKKNKDFFPPP